MTPLSQSRYQAVRELKLAALRRGSDKVVAAVAGCEGFAEERLEKVRAQSRRDLDKIVQGHGKAVREAKRTAARGDGFCRRGSITFGSGGREGARRDA